MHTRRAECAGPYRHHRPLPWQHTAPSATECSYHTRKTSGTRHARLIDTQSQSTPHAFNTRPHSMHKAQDTAHGRAKHEQAKGRRDLAIHAPPLACSRTNGQGRRLIKHAQTTPTHTLNLSHLLSLCFFCFGLSISFSLAHTHTLSHTSTHAHTHKCIPKHAQLQTHSHSDTNIATPTSTRIQRERYKHTHTHTHTHACTHACTHAHAHAHIHTIRTHTCTHINTHTHAHARAHTHTHRKMCVCLDPLTLAIYWRCFSVCMCVCVCVCMCIYVCV